MISGYFKARFHDLYPYYMYETCLAKVFLVRCFNAILRNLLACETVGVTEGLLDPWYLGHCSGAMARTFFLLVGSRFCVFYPQWRQIQLLLLVCATQNISLNDLLVTAPRCMWIFINLRRLSTLYARFWVFATVLLRYSIFWMLCSFSR